MTQRNPGHLELSPALRALGALLAAAWLLYAGGFSALAPFHSGENQIFGQPAWSDFDPSTAYLAAAHQLGWREPAIFIGHPGTPLLVLLAGVQRLLFAFGAGDGTSYTHYTALHLPLVHLASKLLIALLHFASFAALFAFARRLLRDGLGALLACAGYASSLPLLYFASRISVEPLMMLCLFGSFLALWRYEDLARSGKLARALGFAALAGAVAMSGAMAKLNLLAPLTPLLLLLVALTPRGAAAPIDPRTRALALAALTAAGVAALLFWSQWIDWPGFFAFWQKVPAIYGRKAWQLLPAPTPKGALPLCELGFVAVAALGWIASLRRTDTSETRARVLQVSAYAAFALALFGYRVWLERSFLPLHYFIPATGVLAVFFGGASARLLRRVGGATGARMALAALVWIAVVHGLSIWVAFDSRARDALAWGRNAELFERIAQLAPSQRLGFLTPDGRVPPDLSLRLLTIHAIALPDTGPLASLLRRDFEALFVPIDARTAASARERVLVPVFGAQAYVVEPR